MTAQHERWPSPDVEKTEVRVVEVARGEMPTPFGTFTLLAYRALPSGIEYPVLLKKPKDGETPLVRVHSQCATGDIFSSLRCDCGPQLHESMRRVNEHGGVIIYASDHEGRGIGLGNKVRAYALQDQGLDTIEANLRLDLPVDARDYEIAAAILKDLGLTRIALLTNNPEKRKQLTQYGISVAESIPIRISPNGVNDHYLNTKQEKMGHTLELPYEK